MLTVCDQNVLSIAANPQTSAGVSNGNPSTTSNAASGTSGEKLSSQKVNELPLNGHDFSTLLLLAAGTMTDVNGQTNFTQQFAINGQRGVEAVFAMDGADVSDPEMGGSTFTNFNVDAIQELQSSSGWMPADIGYDAAGFTNIVTRSGKSGFHATRHTLASARTGNTILAAKRFIRPFSSLLRVDGTTFSLASLCRTL